MGKWPKWVAAAVVVLLVALAAIFLIPSASRKPSSSPATANAQAALARPASAAFRPVPGEWHLAAGDYANTRYSDLDQITPANAARLAPAFTFDTGQRRGHEAAPLVVGTTMFLVTPYPNEVFALDLTKPDHPVKWTFEPKPDPRSQGVACCDVVNRGMSYDNGRLFFVTLDGQVIALDAASGTQVWRTLIADIARGETVTMAPLVAAGFYAGPGGNRGSFTAWDPVRRRPAWQIAEDLPLWSGVLATGGDLVFYGTLDGWFNARDARTGKLLWQYKTQSGIVGQPITYRGPDGRQYVAVYSGTDWADTCVLAALMHTRHGIEGRRFVDTSENALYWRFVWLAWLPIYFVIYWLPRLS